MNHKLDKTQNKIYHRIALENNLPDDRVYEIMDLFYKFIYEKLTLNNIDLINSLNEFKNTKVNFNIKNFGKIIIPYERFKKKNKKYNN